MMCGRGTLTKEDSRVPQRSQNGGAVLARRGHRDCDSRLLKLFQEHFGTGCRTDAFFQLLSKQLRPAITGVWTVSASSPSCSILPEVVCLARRENSERRHSADAHRHTRGSWNGYQTAERLDPAVPPTAGGTHRRLFSMQRHEP